MKTQLALRVHKDVAAQHEQLLLHADLTHLQTNEFG